MPGIPEITVKTLKERIDAGETPFLLDVRRQEEHEFVNIGGKLIQLDHLPNHLDDLEDQKDKENYRILPLRCTLRQSRTTSTYTWI